MASSLNNFSKTTVAEKSEFKVFQLLKMLDTLWLLYNNIVLDANDPFRLVCQRFLMQFASTSFAFSTLIDQMF